MAMDVVADVSGVDHAAGAVAGFVVALGPAARAEAGRGGVRRWLGLGWPGWRPGGFFFIFLNKTKTKIKHYL